MFVNRLWITELPKTAHHFPPYHIGNRLETRSFEAVIFLSLFGVCEIIFCNVTKRCQ